jgi:hypothetical protein
MPVIDVDTHWEIAHIADDEHPLAPWRGQFPGDALAQLAHGVAGELLFSLPEADRPAPSELLAGLVNLAEQHSGPATPPEVREAGLATAMSPSESAPVRFSIAWRRTNKLPDR